MFFPADKGKPFGCQTRPRGDAYGDWMFAQQPAHAARPTPARALTNEFLPGQGLPLRLGSG